MFRDLGATFEPTYREKLWMYDPRTEVGRKRREKQKALLENFLPIEGGRALDIGCGMGSRPLPLKNLASKSLG